MDYKRIKRPRFDDPKSTMIDSEVLDGLQYEIKGTHIIIYGGKRGTFVLDLKLLRPVLMELHGISEVWKGR